ncbi:MAG: M23 family metallopeptidase [Rhodobacteraceae bacterium]|nr:M23 family metallopeptidase [Paracoccaceae bacterium]
MRRIALLALTLTLAPPVGASDFMLRLPLDCTLGQSCFIQHQVDRDPGPAVTDYHCGGLSYDGHKGTDFRLPTLADMERGVNVLAAAPGVVRGLRDGVADVGPTATTAGKECGNGVMLRHANGWETQYCHMKSGSLRVQPGQRLTAGTVLGQVGLSGKSDFPHLHLTLRRDGTVVDPFDLSDFPTCGEQGDSLWQQPIPYQAGGLLGLGFSTAVPQYSEIKAGTAAQSPLPADAPALVIWAHAFGGKLGDILSLTLDGPAGRLVDHRAPLTKDQAEFFRAAGKRLKGSTWPSGDYVGAATLIRSGVEVSRFESLMRIP